MKKLIVVLNLILFSVSITYGQHSIVLKSGEKMSGELLSVKDGNVTFIFKGNAMNFKVSEVSAIYLEEKITTSALEVKSGITSSGTKGVSYIMNGRKLVNQPKVDNLTQERGTVVVSINIDKYGHVKKAEPGAEGTTTQSSYLLTKAKQAAESAIFDNCPTCPLDTKGTITVIF